MYQALYRKWRPQAFADVVGQPHITTTLTNEIIAGKHSHAYLFTGSRGTGKTTCAKIFAKAVNCLDPQEGNPCNRCEICKGIDNGSILDVIEIDAASNNGVDNIRDLREEANFTPVNTKYRVYIIDEVHMLSSGAFNALLKTLEEPPPHVKFVLATTEVHKLPATIISRCQRFDFRRILPDDIADRLSFVASNEGVTLQNDAAILIARLADGALRDALSILDQCMGRGDTVTVSTVNEVVGLAGRDYLFDLADCVLKNDSARALDSINYLYNRSCDMERLCIELINHFRNLMIVKTVESPQNLIICTDEELGKLKAGASGFNIEQILSTMDVLGQALNNLRKGLNRRVEMEITVIRLCTPQLNTDNEALIGRIVTLENAFKMGLPAFPEIRETPEFAEPIIRRGTSDAPEQVMTEAKAGMEQKLDIRHETPLVTETVPMVVTEEENKKAVIFEKPDTVQTAETEDADKPIIKKDTVFVPFERWDEVIKVITEIDKGLIGLINESSALKRGNTVFVRTDNPVLKRLVGMPIHSEMISQAISKATGEDCSVALYEKTDTAGQQKESKPKDPLEDLVNRVKNSDINYTIEE